VLAKPLAALNPRAINCTALVKVERPLSLPLCACVSQGQDASLAPMHADTRGRALRRACSLLYRNPKNERRATMMTMAPTI